MSINQIGAYGDWAATLSGNKPGSLSLRNGKFNNLDDWRAEAKAKVLECLSPPPMPSLPEITVESSEVINELRIEKLSWQLPYGPRTEAIYLKLEGASQKELPGVLALHDHGGLKYFGWQKIAQTSQPTHPIIIKHRAECYGGLAWANELARRGYAVLVPDCFSFGSRRVKLSDVPPAISQGLTDPDGDDPTDQINAYNRWAGGHESIMAKSLFSAGTSWPGVTLRDDQVSLSILESLPGVDSTRLGCGGLSGGGVRTVYLAGLDERIKSCFCAGFMTTWRDQLLNKSHTHTWMTFAPHLPHLMDFAEILGLRAPMPVMVVHCTSDPLFTNEEVEVCRKQLEEVYAIANAPEAFKHSNYPGGHQLNAAMQKDVFNWLDRWLKW